MDVHSLREKAIGLQSTVEESRRKLVTLIREIDRREIWKKLGFKSIRDYCRKELKLDDFEMRELLIAGGLILTREQMVDADPKTQKRIDRLFDWRKSRAQQQNIPAYLIFPNQVLMAIAQAHPTILEDLAQIPGIGTERFSKYGREIIKCLKD